MSQWRLAPAPKFWGRGGQGREEKGKKAHGRQAGIALGRTTVESRGGWQSTINRVSVTEAHYMTTALHFPGLLSKLEPNIEGYNSEFEFELIVRIFEVCLTSLLTFLLGFTHRYSSANIY